VVEGSVRLRKRFGGPAEKVGEACGETRLADQGLEGLKGNKRETRARPDIWRDKDGQAHSRSFGPAVPKGLCAVGSWASWLDLREACDVRRAIRSGRFLRDHKDRDLVGGAKSWCGRDDDPQFFAPKAAICRWGFYIAPPKGGQGHSSVLVDEKPSNPSAGKTVAQAIWKLPTRTPPGNGKYASRLTRGIDTVE